MNNIRVFRNSWQQKKRRPFLLYAPGAVDTGASLLLRQSDMNHHPKLLLLCVRGLSTYNPDKVSIDEHVTMLLKSGECAVSII